MIMAAYVLCNIKRSQSSHMRRYFVNGKANVMKVSLSFLLSRFKNISFVLLFKKFIYNAIIIMFRIIRTIYCRKFRSRPVTLPVLLTQQHDIWMILIVLRQHWIGYQIVTLLLLPLIVVFVYEIEDSSRLFLQYQLSLCYLVHVIHKYFTSWHRQANRT